MAPLDPSIYLPIASALAAAIVYLERERRSAWEKTEVLLREVLDALSALEVVEERDQ